jgi:hypothetical protein
MASARIGDTQKALKYASLAIAGEAATSVYPAPGGHRVQR